MIRRDTAELAIRLGHRFDDPGLLEQALTHRSTARRRPGGVGHGYERLEFLGDRVLGLAVADLLMARFPDEDEGALSKRHAALVRREALVRVAGGLRLGDYLRLSKGEAGAGGRRAPAVLADACEAVIAALYLDGGLAVAARFIASHWSALIDETPTPPRDAKTALQEWAQGRGLGLPTYRTLREEGPAHRPRFEIEVAVEGVAPAVAEGGSKRAAEQAAAAALLASLAQVEDG